MRAADVWRREELRRVGLRQNSTRLARDDIGSIRRSVTLQEYAHQPRARLPHRGRRPRSRESRSLVAITQCLQRRRTLGNKSAQYPIAFVGQMHRILEQGFEIHRRKVLLQVDELRPMAPRDFLD